MAATKDFICARAMTDNGRNYERGDKITLSEADAVNLLALGSILELAEASKEAAPPPAKKPTKVA